MEQGLGQINQLFNAVVNLFGAVFGFLPSWVLVFVGGAIVFVVGVFIYKLIRG